MGITERDGKVRERGRGLRGRGRWTSHPIRFAIRLIRRFLVGQVGTWGRIAGMGGEGDVVRFPPQLISSEVLNSVRISLRSTISTKSFSPLHPAPGEALPFTLSQPLKLNKTDVRDVLDDLDPTLTRRRVAPPDVQSPGSDVTGSCGFSESVPAAIRDIHKGLVVLAWFSWCQTKGDGTGANKEMWCRCLLGFVQDAVKSAGKYYRDLIADENVQLNTGVQVAADAGYFKTAVNRLIEDAVAGGLVGLDIVGEADTGNFIEQLNVVRGECEREVRKSIALFCGRSEEADIE
jgi:hypothetical protein